MGASNGGPGINMANTIAHLMVAQRIISKKPDFVKDLDAYYMGTIAPDTISSMPGWTRDDKKITHLRLAIPDLEWLQEHMMQTFNERVDEFVKLHITNPAISEGAGPSGSVPATGVSGQSRVRADWHSPDRK